jgi:hypothetical protein
MPPSSRLPSHAVHVPTYAELEHYVRAFAAGHFNLLLLLGSPGVGKSRAVRQALAGPFCWIGGQATALGIYVEAYRHRHLPIVLDDVDGLDGNRDGIRVLKALAQTEPRKTLSWLTKTSLLQRAGVPRQFTTTSRLLLIGNAWKTRNADVAALEDRGHLLLFQPTALEVHRHAALWFWDQEVFDFLGDRLHLIAQHSLRSYGHAWELKQAGLNWRQAVLSRFLTGAALAVATLKANPHFTNEAQRVAAFVQSGAGCRATYFRHAKQIQPVQAPLQIALTQTGPPATALPCKDYLNQLRRRFGRLGNG